MFFKKINSNHKDLLDDELWTKDSVKNIFQKTENTWHLLSINLKIKFVKVSSVDEISPHIVSDWGGYNKKSIIILDHENIELENFYEEIQKLLISLNSENSDTVGIFSLQKNELIKPYKEMQMSFFQKFTDREKSRNISYYNGLKRSETFIQNFVTKNFTITKNIEEFQNQLKIKNDKLEIWKSRLVKSNMWDEDEEIIDTCSAVIRRSNWKIRSNLTKRGYFLLTNKRIVFVRKKFSLFNVNPLTLIPLVAYVRPSNKYILFFRTIYQFVRVPFQVIKGFRPVLGNIWPYVIVLSVGLPNINFGSIGAFFDNFFIRFPAFNFIKIGFSFVVEYPSILPSFAGFYAGIRFGFLKYFMKREEIISVPLDNITTLQKDGNLLVSRMRLKGSKLVSAPENGIEFKFYLRSRSKDTNSDEISNNIYSNLMNLLYKEKTSIDSQ